MSRPQQDAEASREGATRRKRNKRRPGRGKNIRRDATDDATAQSGVAIPEPTNDARRGEPNGIAAVSNGEYPTSPSREARKRHRRRKRRGTKSGNQPDINAAGQENGSVSGIGEIRNLRSPIKPVPDASFTPPPKSKRRNKQRFAKHRHGENSKNKRNRYFAALDLGTNNCRLLVAVPQKHNRFKVVDAFSRIIRLGEGLGNAGRLSDEAMDRAIEALSICASKLASRRIAGMRLIATEACRSASNGAEFLARVRNETGLDLEIVDRETEARLAAEGCGSLMDHRAEGAVLFDIGGGSSELILVNRNSSRSKRISQQITGWTSLPMGVVTLSERHGGKQVSRSTFDTMVGEVMDHLEAFEGRHSLADIWGRGRTHLLGTSGTVTTIAGVHLNLQRYDRRKVDGIWLSDRQIDKVIDDLLSMDYEQRANNPCIRRERADLVLAGCAILQAIRQSWPSERLRVADRGLREGILNQLMQKAGVWDHSGRNNSKRETGGRPQGVGR
ncbi:MAG: Ppx/GppA phosphatase family protein [Pseudomonadota bacterium]